MRNEMCEGCDKAKDCQTSCAAITTLYHLAKIEDRRSKEEFLANVADMLAISRYEKSEDVETIAMKLIAERPLLGLIELFNLSVGYIESTKREIKDGNPVLGKCIKVQEMYQAYIPYDFIIIIYTSNAWDLDEKQLEILVYHELRHIKMGLHGPTVRAHDIEDFRDIIDRYGLDWERFSPDDDEDD